MTSTINLISSMKRPSLLVRASRLRIDEYNRKRDLCKILHKRNLPAHGKALTALISTEDQMEIRRVEGDATYRIATHVLILCALMVETRLAQLHLA